MPSVLASLGMKGMTDRIGLDLDVDRVCLLLVDGMGAELLAANVDAAPFLADRSPTVLTTGFPSTTATSLTSLGTGVPPGEHGIVGYLLAVPGHDRLMNPLKWRLHGPGPKVDLLKAVAPEQFQSTQTLLDQAATSGITVTKVAPMYQSESGLSRAALRGGGFRAAFSMGDLVDGALTALRDGDRSLVYAYHGELDLTGHVRGPDSLAWALELAQVDTMARAIAERLPPRSALVVTADHGMVTVREPVDFDTTPELRDGVARLGGEPRARHVYTEHADEVTVAWRELLGPEYLVLTRPDAVEAGWFGPIVSADIAGRIGDVVCAAVGSGAVIRSGVEPLQSSLLGHHGSLTSAEMNVPLLVYT
ncbi:alkaline phosphatase family protein [Skermania sp. ID1734]|nr:alkaline phosphatase family protein [Skermania sp. ID1734]